MTDDLVKRLLADELPNDGQWEKEARMVLHLLLKEAADRIEELKARVLRLEGYLNGALNVIVASDTKEARAELEKKDGN